jgi:hypothetical protein
MKRSYKTGKKAGLDHVLKMIKPSERTWWTLSPCKEGRKSRVRTRSAILERPSRDMDSSDGTNDCVCNSTADT